MHADFKDLVQKYLKFSINKLHIKYSHNILDILNQKYSAKVICFFTLHAFFLLLKYAI